MTESAPLTIGGLASAAGVGVETIRFYQRKGLLAQPRRAYGQVRRYGASEVARVMFVRSAQSLGFTLEEVAALLQLEDGTRCDEARMLAVRKLADVRSKLRDLRRLEAALTTLVADCSTRQGRIACPLISALHAQAPDHRAVRGSGANAGRRVAT